MIPKFKLTHEMAIVLLSRISLAVLSLLVLQALLLVLKDVNLYGRFMFLFSIASWFTTVLYGAANIPMARFGANIGEENKLKYDSTVVSMVSIVFIPVFIGVFVLASGILYLAEDIPSENSTSYAFLVTLTTTLLGTAAVFGTYVLGQRRRIFNLLITNGVLLARLAALIALLLAGLHTVEHVMYGTVLALASVCIFGGIFLIRGATFSPPTDVKKVMVELGFVKQYKNNWPISLGSNFLLHGDKVVLGILLPLEIIGLLALYQQLARVLSNVSIGAIYQFVVPILLSGSNKHPRTLKDYALVSVISSAIFLSMAAIMGIFLPYVNKYVLHGLTDLTFIPLMLVAISVSFNQSSKFIELDFYRADKIPALIVPLAVSTTLFLTVGLFLALNYGLVGAITGLLISAASRFLLSAIMLHRSRASK